MSYLSKTNGILEPDCCYRNNQAQKINFLQNMRRQTTLTTLFCTSIFIITFLAGSSPAQTFTSADFEGTWNLHGLATGYPDDFQSWAYGIMTCDSNGDFIQRSTNNTGGINEVTGKLDISPEGIITIPGGSGHGSDFHGIMNNNKDTIVLTGNDGGGGYFLAVYTKSGGTFTTSDLEGTSVCHGLISGNEPDQVPGWFYNSITIDREGNATFSHVTDSQGNKDYIPYPDKFSITEDGLVTMPKSEVPFYGVMNQGKDVIVFVATMAPGGIHVVRGYNLTVALKT